MILLRETCAPNVLGASKSSVGRQRLIGDDLAFPGTVLKTKLQRDARFFLRPNRLIAAMCQNAGERLVELQIRLVAIVHILIDGEVS